MLGQQHTSPFPCMKYLKYHKLSSRLHNIHYGIKIIMVKTNFNNKEMKSFRPYRIKLINDDDFLKVMT